MANDGDSEDFVFVPENQFEELQERIAQLEGGRPKDTTNDMLGRMVSERRLREPAGDPLGDHNIDTSASDRQTLQEFERIWPEIKNNLMAEAEAQRRIAALGRDDAAYLVSEFRRRERR